MGPDGGRTRAGHGPDTRAAYFSTCVLIIRIKQRNCRDYTIPLKREERFSRKHTRSFFFPNSTSTDFYSTDSHPRR